MSTSAPARLTSAHLDFTRPLADGASAPISVIADQKCRALLHHGDCLKKMEGLSTESVDLVLTDLPYGVSRNKWDVPIPFKEMWAAFERVLKPNGVVVLTATQPFTSLLVCSNLPAFKYECIWEKSIGSGQLNIRHQPLRTHESVLVFYQKKPTYNEQRTEGAPYAIQRKLKSGGEGYGPQKESAKQNDGFRHAKSTIFFPNPRIKNGHPTQKPVGLMELLIRTYTNEGDTVLDCCMGSGTTGVAAVNLRRSFIGIELDAHWFNRAVQRIAEAGAR